MVHVSLTVALVSKSQDLFLRRKKKQKTLGLEWKLNPQPHISGVMLYQLSYQAFWEQGCGEEGIQVLVLGAHYIKMVCSIREVYLMVHVLRC